MKVWQVATGEPGCDYRELFFDHDIMILGPSQLGPATSGAYADSVSNSAKSQVHSFAHRPQPGDRVLMRFAHKVIGVGEIPQQGGYSFDEMFRCVYGWDLRHCRRVVWAEGYSLGPLGQVFEQAKQKPSFTQVHEQSIVGMVAAIPSSYFVRPLRDMPCIDPKAYTDEDLGIELFRAGISNNNIDDIIRALEQAARLCAWYESAHCGRKPSENEVVSHIVLPLLLSLGWSHQQIAIEWKNVDMALFKRTPTTASNCVLVLEAKGLGRALTDVLEQPLNYIRSLGLTDTRYIVVTDGAHLFVYERANGGWSTQPIGYLSVLSLQHEYVLPRNTSVVNTLVMLQPSLV